MEVIINNDAHFLYKKIGFIQYPYSERVMKKNAKLSKKINKSTHLSR